MNKQRQFILNTKVLDKENRIIEMIGSTEDADRVGDRMFMAGVQLGNYLKNPVILQNHNYQLAAIGKAINVKVAGSQLIFQIQFADTQDGQEWFYLYANKFMNASSIGFDPIEYNPNEQGGYDFTKWELLELSLVTVPCNPNAIQRAFKDGKISKAFFDAINKNEEDKKLNKEEIEALISKTMKPLEETIKTLKEEGETKDNTIKSLEDEIKELEKEPVIKSGAALSAKSKSALADIHKSISGCCDQLKSFIGAMDDDDPDKDQDKDKGLEPTTEEIQAIAKDAAEAVANIIKSIK